jgi:hypothetical protein
MTFWAAVREHTRHWRRLILRGGNLPVSRVVAWSALGGLTASVLLALAIPDAAAQTTAIVDAQGLSEKVAVLGLRVDRLEQQVALTTTLVERVARIELIMYAVLLVIGPAAATVGSYFGLLLLGVLRDRIAKTAPENRP